MIDHHTHILPGIDDGSRDIEMTEKMLAMEKEQGVDLIWATPHFYAYRRSISDFLDRRERSVEAIKELTESGEYPKIAVGAEVYYFPGMGGADRLEELCVEKDGERSDILLLEMPFDQWTSEIYKDVDELVRGRGLKVILAHVERYFRFQKKKDTWQRVLDLPLMLQVNGESFLQSGKERKFVNKLLKEEERVILGSDAHNITDRAPNMGKALSYIEKKLGQSATDRLRQTSEQLSR